MPTGMAPRRALAKMVVALVGLHALAILAFRVAGIEHRSFHTRYLFVGVWTMVTALVAAWGLRQVRQARLSARRRGGPA